MAVNALNKLAHPIHGSRKSCYKAEPLNEEQKEKEKQFLLDFHANASPLSPEQVTQDPRNKELGAASKQLHKEDFEMMTTLGTGAMIDQTRWIWSRAHRLQVLLLAYGLHAWLDVQKRRRTRSSLSR